MEAEVNWSFRSEKSLEKIYNYIAQDSPIYAINFINELIQTTEDQLTAHPLIGRKVPEFNLTPLSFLREIIFKGYRIIYNPTIKGNVTIITVINGRMDIVREFD